MKKASLMQEYHFLTFELNGRQRNFLLVKFNPTHAIYTVQKEKIASSSSGLRQNQGQIYFI